jgi:hypothetical protein
MGERPPSAVARWVAAAIVPALVLIGCLFPGFDKFEGGAASNEDDTGGKDASKDRGAGSSGTSGTSGTIEDSSSGNPLPDGSSGAPSKEIICIADGGRCPIPSQFCCTTIDGPQCQDVQGISAPSNCKIQGFPGAAKAFLCDGAEDCAPGQVCCFSDLEDGQGVNARCSVVCPTNQVVCNTTTNLCSGGSCTGTVANGTFKICQ